MDAVVVLLTLLLVAGVLIVISAPLRARAAERRSTRESGHIRREPERGALEAEREAKYREIRDADLDFRTGKLSPEDHAAIDAALRSEALDILNRLERRGGDVSAAERSAEDSTSDQATPRGA